MLDNIVIEPQTSQKAEYSIIWLHGLGAEGSDFVPLANALGKIIDKPLRFVFPHAPLRPVTLNNGYVMRAWYDVTGLTLESKEDREGLTEVSTHIHSLIQDQINAGIAPKNIFLGGFSQGGGSILYAGLRYPQPLGGLIVLSGYLPLGKNLPQEKQPSNQDIPIFWGHGSKDTVVPLAWAEISCACLQSCGFENRKFHTYPISHEVCEKEIADLGQWFKENA